MCRIGNHIFQHKDRNPATFPDHLIFFMKIDAVENINCMQAGITLNFIMPSGTSRHNIHLLCPELTMYCSGRRLVVK